jgi:site-specific DNA-methyltransferase (adenine-specific)
MINLYNQDCMQAMREAPDDYWDLAIVDPPYGINYDGNTTIGGISGKANTFNVIQHHKKKGWDKQRPNANYFSLLMRVSKNVIIWGGNYFADILPPSKGWIYWDKQITQKSKLHSDGELAYTSFSKKLTKFSYGWIGFDYLNNPHKERKIHPTQKPIALYTWLLSTYAKKGDKILDTHLGSGSSAIAAHRMGFSFDGYEIDKDYFEGAKARLEQAQRQLLLFG